MNSKSRRQRIHTALIHLVLMLGSVVFLTPFVWLLSTSVKEEEDMLRYPPVWVPRRQEQVMVDGKARGLSLMAVDGRSVRVAEMEELEDGSKKVRILDGQPDAGAVVIAVPGSLTKQKVVGFKWRNYTDALDFLPEGTMRGLVFLQNTLIITLLSILGTLVSSSMVAYSFARLRWPGRDTIFAVLLATMMIPGAVTMIPVFLIFRWLGWVDTLNPLWVPAFLGGPFAVFLLRQFFLTIPRDLEEAARLDGAGYWTTYWRIMLPLVKPALATLTIMTFMGSWNNFMGPLIYLNSPEKMTLSYALQLFQGEHSTEYGMVMAASTMVMLPVLAIFFFTQRYFIEGIALTGMKN